MNAPFRHLEEWFSQNHSHLHPDHFEWIRANLNRARASLEAGDCLWRLEVAGLILGSEGVLPELNEKARELESYLDAHSSE